MPSTAMRCVHTEVPYAVVLCCGPQAIVAGIEAVDVVPGRCEIIDEGQAFPVIVDSALTAESFSRLLVMRLPHS